MKIVDLLNKKTVLPDLEVVDKKEALVKLINALSAQVNKEELNKIREAVFEREEIMSTGVGKGLAIPHGKTSSISKSYAAFAVLHKAIDYQAVDGKPVKMIFLLVGPQSSNRTHIKLLSRISRLMNNNEFREKLIASKTAGKIIELFGKEEQMHFGI